GVSVYFQSKGVIARSGEKGVGLARNGLAGLQRVSDRPLDVPARYGERCPVPPPYPRHLYPVGHVDRATIDRAESQRPPPPIFDRRIGAHDGAAGRDQTVPDSVGARSQTVGDPSHEVRSGAPYSRKPRTPTSAAAPGEHRTGPASIPGQPR